MTVTQMHHNLSGADWERMWAPYDEATYGEVLRALHPDDVVLDIGAGDLRLARRMAEICQHVTAIEIRAELIQQALESGGELPSNLQTMCMDARTCTIPPGTSTAVLLMRHCRVFKEYADHLRDGGCQRLITNARWGMGVEVIDLMVKRVAYAQLEMGWFACWCGEVGFKPGPVERIQPELADFVNEVSDCPGCHPMDGEDEPVYVIYS